MNKQTNSYNNYHNNSNSTHKNDNYLSLYKPNIFWLVLIIFNYLTNSFAMIMLDNFVSNNKCYNDYNCYDIVFILIDKNYFLSYIIYYFGLGQLLIFGLDFLIGISNKIKYNLANIIGLVYMSSILWDYSLIWSWNFNEIYRENYLFYIETTDFVDSIRILLNFYLINEVLIIIAILLSIILYVLYLFLNLSKPLLTSLLKKKFINKLD